MREQLQEIFATISRNKLRTFLTGFSVAWGIFMLIVLLGSGNGLRNAMTAAFATESVNVVRVGAWKTSMPYKGFQKDRNIRLKDKDVQVLKKEFPHMIVDIAAEAGLWNASISYGREFSSVSLTGTTSAMARIQGIKVTEGRFINETDYRELRKVVVLDDQLVPILFKKQNPIGRMVTIQGAGYTVVGVYKGRTRSNSMGVYVPLSTFFLAFQGDRRDVGSIQFSVQGIKTDEDSKAFEQAIRRRLSAEHYFAPEDKSAVWVYNRMEDFKNTMKIFDGIALFVWIIGIGTLTAGVVGVSNIMLVTVRERTFEFGIRKALGAKPISLVRLILVESVLITAFFGYVGMIGGVAIMEVVNLFMERAAAAAPADEWQMFKNPTLDLSVTFSATLVLVVAGVIAGYVPAKRAARIKTIDAMRHNR